MACLKTSGTQCTSRDPSRWRLTHPGKGLQRSPNTPRNLIGAVGTSRGCMALPPHTDQSSALSLQVPLCPLPPVPGYTLVSPHRHFLAAVAETLSLGAPGIQRAQGPVCVLTLVYEALQGCVYVCVCVSIFVFVWCVHPCCRLLGSRVLQGVACLSLTYLFYILRSTPRAVLWDLCLDLCSGGRGLRAPLRGIWVLSYSTVS